MCIHGGVVVPRCCCPHLLVSWGPFAISDKTGIRLAFGELPNQGKRAKQRVFVASHLPPNSRRFDGFVVCGVQTSIRDLDRYRGYRLLCQFWNQLRLGC